MTKTHRIITEEEFNTDGKLIHKIVTEETEEWEDAKTTDRSSDCPGTLPHQLEFQWTNPCEYVSRDYTGTPPRDAYTITAATNASR